MTIIDSSPKMIVNGDTSIDRINNHTSIAISDGSLTVKCAVPDGTTIHISSAKSAASNGFFDLIKGFFTNLIPISIDNTSINIKFSFFNRCWFPSNKTVQIIFEKQVGKNVTIKCNDVVDAIFKQNVGAHSRIETISGNILGQTFETNTTLTSISGKIKGNISKGVVKSISGDIVFDELQGNARATTVSGDIKIVSKDPSAMIKTTSGKIKIKKTTSYPTTSSSHPGSSIYASSSSASSSSSSSAPASSSSSSASSSSSSSAPASSLSSYNKHVDQYLALFDKIIPYSIQCETLNIDDDEIPQEFKDPVTLTVCNHPLLVQGFIIDKCTVEALQKTSKDGKMINPHTNSRDPNDLFTVADLQPNRSIKNAIETFIHARTKK